jgi:hypothetical protein
MDAPIIRELTPNLRFFDRDAFADIPWWGACYWLEPRFTGTVEEWKAVATAARLGEVRHYDGWADE